MSVSLKNKDFRDSLEGLVFMYQDKIEEIYDNLLLAELMRIYLLQG